MAAVQVAKYLVPHAEAVLNMMQAQEESGDADALYVLKWINRHDHREFTKRDPHQHGRRRFRKADDIAPAFSSGVPGRTLERGASNDCHPCADEAMNVDVQGSESSRSAQHATDTKHDPASRLTGTRAVQALLENTGMSA